MTNSTWTTEKKDQLFPPAPPSREQVARSVAATRHLLSLVSNAASPTVVVLRRDVETLLAAAELWASNEAAKP